jgi:hypothetical protein
MLYLMLSVGLLSYRERISAVDERTPASQPEYETLAQLLKQSTDLLLDQQKQIAALEGRLQAHTLVVITMLQGMRRLQPHTYKAVLRLLEETGGDLTRAGEDRAVLRELSEIVASLRAAASEPENEPPDAIH